MATDPTVEKVDRFAREQLAVSRGRLVVAREEHAAAMRLVERLSGRVERLEVEVAGWAERAGGDV